MQNLISTVWIEIWLSDGKDYVTPDIFLFPSLSRLRYLYRYKIILVILLSGITLSRFPNSIGLSNFGTNSKIYWIEPSYNQKASNPTNGNGNEFGLEIRSPSTRLIVHQADNCGLGLVRLKRKKLMINQKGAEAPSGFSKNRETRQGGLLD